MDTIREAVAADPRLEALLAAGSYIHGGFDQHSDLDFVIVCNEAHYGDVMASRQRFAQGLGELLSAFSGEHVGEPRLLICLYGPDLLHVDLKFVTPGDLDRLVERPAVIHARHPDLIESRLDAAAIAWPACSRDWFEQRAWTWLHYAATKLARGELFEAIGMLAFFREQVLGPMIHRRAGRAQRGVRRVESVAAQLGLRLADTSPAPEEAAVRSAILAAITLYLDLRADQPPGEPVARMPEALISFVSG